MIKDKWNENFAKPKIYFRNFCDSYLNRLSYSRDEIFMR